MSHTVVDEQLAILGGPLAVPDSDQHDEIVSLANPVTDEDEQAVLDVLRAPNHVGHRYHHTVRGRVCPVQWVPLCAQLSEWNPSTSGGHVGCRIAPR